MPSPGTWETAWQLMPKSTRPIKVLDAGCGPMYWDFPNCEIHRCDIIPQSLPNFRLVDLNKPWPYHDGEFTGVVSIEVLEHLENPWHFFREASRVTTDFIVASTPNPSSPLSKKMFTETGRFKWFTEVDTGPSLRHITPIFKWQLDMILQELDLTLDWYGYNDAETQEIQVFRILKRRNSELKYSGEVSWEVQLDGVKLLFFKHSPHRYLLERDQMRAWWVSTPLLKRLQDSGIKSETVVIPNPLENHEEYLSRLGYKIHRRDPILPSLWVKESAS